MSVNHRIFLLQVDKYHIHYILSLHHYFLSEILDDFTHIHEGTLLGLIGVVLDVDLAGGRGGRYDLPHAVAMNNLQERIGLFLLSPRQLLLQRF